MVTIIFPSILLNITRQEKSVTLSATTVREAFTQLISRYGEPFQQKLLDPSGHPKRFLNIYLNGKNINFINNFESHLQDNDELTILPSITGG
jgi:molybdopterin converting factor small subunit